MLKPIGAPIAPASAPVCQQTLFTNSQIQPAPQVPNMIASHVTQAPQIAHNPGINLLTRTAPAPRTGLFGRVASVARNTINGIKHLLGRAPKLIPDVSSYFEQAALAGTGLSIPVSEIEDTAPQRVEIPTTFFMAKKKPPRKKGGATPGGAPTGRRPRKTKPASKRPEMFEDRAARWIENFFKGSKVVNFFKSAIALIWDPPKFDGSCYKWKQETGGKAMGSASFVMHRSDKVLTRAILDKVKPHVAPAWSDDETPHIIEFGAGSGDLARATTRETNALVQEVDLVEGKYPSDLRMIADLTNQEGIKT